MTIQNIYAQGHALIVGVGEGLACTVNDAEGLARYFKDEARCAYPTEQVHVLTESKANRTGLLSALDKLVHTVKKDDTVIFYFSGHGAQYSDNYYLMTYGSDVSNLDETAVSSAKFVAKIAAIPAKRKVILLDCCHAGGIGGVKNQVITKSPLPQDAVDLFRQGSGYIIIASSKENEFSFTGKPYSVFTGVLIEALCGQGVAKKDGYVRVGDLAGHTREKVPQLTGNEQHPVLHFTKADNFIVAYYAGGEKQPKAIPFQLQAHNLTASIKNIEELFVRARYDQAYKEFFTLCADFPDYKTRASMILARYNDYQDQLISGIIPVQNTVKLEISSAFQVCLKQFTQEYI